MNVSALARSLGMSRSTVMSRLKNGTDLNAPLITREERGKMAAAKREAKVIPGLDNVIVARRPKNPFSCWRPT